MDERGSPAKCGGQKPQDGAVHGGPKNGGYQISANGMFEWFRLLTDRDAKLQAAKRCAN